MTLAFLDVEASGLHSSSYPVEIAWCRHDLTAGWSSLIRPAPSWGEDDWSPASERIHGIGRLQTMMIGRPVIEVIESLNHDLAGSQVMTDHPEADATWVWRAFLEVKANPTFYLVEPLMHSKTARARDGAASPDAFDVDILIIKLAADAGLTAGDVEDLGRQLRAEAGIIPHRALDDCIGHALDVAAIAILQLMQERIEAAAAFRDELLHRAHQLIKVHGRR